MHLTIPKNYNPSLSFEETEKAIIIIKEYFQKNLADMLHLERVTAPLFVKAGTGINDDLNGIEKPVSFLIKAMDNAEAEIVQSLAKWKRLALTDYGFEENRGLYADMNALRPDEILDNLHSIYVDQWDWELRIREEQRNLKFLKKIVSNIYQVIVNTEIHLETLFPKLKSILPQKITFLHSEELEERYPDLIPADREHEICKEFGAVFLIGIGNPLSNGKPHDGRAPDYDDWSTETKSGFYGLNGDLLVWNQILETAYELSSMGIRVNENSLEKQLKLSHTEKRRHFYYHKRLLAGELTSSIGGGIGQSRLCMFFLRKAHIGEVQVSLWPDDMIISCNNAGIKIL